MHNKNYLKKFKKFTSAFGLIEIMIAATLLSIGLLGAASIQSQSLNITMESSLKETASTMTNQLSDFIMNADNSELQKMISSVSSTEVSSTDDTACNNTACTSDNFYAVLLAGWRKSVNLLLPNGKVCLCSTSSSTIRIAIQWVNLSGADRQHFFDQEITTTVIINSCAPTNVNAAGCSQFL